MKYYATKWEADRLLRIDIRWLKQQDFLSGYKSGVIKWTLSGREYAVKITISILGRDDHMRLQYTQTESNNEKKDFDYRIVLTTTPCNYGAKRYWFICPLFINGKYCGRRVGTLYKAGDYFGCRHCYNLTYRSRNINKNQFHRIIYLEAEIDKLSAKMKREHYAGKPTKLQDRLRKVSGEFMDSIDGACEKMSTKWC